MPPCQSHLHTIHLQLGTSSTSLALSLLTFVFPTSCSSQCKSRRTRGVKRATEVPTGCSYGPDRRPTLKSRIRTATATVMALACAHAASSYHSCTGSTVFLSEGGDCCVTCHRLDDGQLYFCVQPAFSPAIFPVVILVVSEEYCSLSLSLSLSCPPEAVRVFTRLSCHTSDEARIRLRSASQFLRRTSSPRGYPPPPPVSGLSPS